MRHYRFIGEIWNVIFFSEVICVRQSTLRDGGVIPIAAAAGGQYDGTPLGFKALEEPRNVYQVVDGSKLFVRIVLKEVRRTIKDGILKYTAVTEETVTVVSAPELKGSPPASPPDDEKLQKSMDRKGLHFMSIGPEDNEYLLGDGTRIKMRFDLCDVSRTSLHDARGGRIYIIDHCAHISVKPIP